MEREPKLIESAEKNIPLLALGGTPLFESEISLQVYPLPYIFAEKLETVVYRGEVNSRMKDFYDLWLLRDNRETRSESARKIVLGVFDHRGTSLPPALEFREAALDRLDRDWKRFLRVLSDEARRNVPDRFMEIAGAVDGLIAWVRS